MVCQPVGRLDEHVDSALVAVGALGTDDDGVAR